MTQTKLEIIGPYAPEHEGPYAWGGGAVSRCTIHSVVQGVAFITSECIGGPFCTDISNIQNAREVPVAREFWVNKYNFRELSAAYPTKEMADSFAGRDRVECIHVREVLPGEGA